MCPESRPSRRSKFCTCPRYMAMRVSLCPVPVGELCLSLSLFCRLISLCFSQASPELHVDAPPAVPYFCFPVWISTLLTGKCIRNCLYLNWLGNQPLAKRSFRKVVLADSCRGFNLATTSSSVSYHECVPNRACQEGRKSWLSLFGFRKFCACPLIMATQVSLLRISVAEPRSEMPAR